MYIIAGLGNPTKEYEGTRHNIGFEVIDELAERNSISVDGRKSRAFIGKGMIKGEKVILAKPQTYMNLSGESINALAAYYKVPAEQVIIIYDDISLEPGAIRVRGKGSAGGHNGMKSIISSLGSQEFPRVRIGIGSKPPRMDLADYVLSRFSKGEKEAMEAGVQDGAISVEMILSDGLEAAMNHYNRKQR